MTNKRKQSKMLGSIHEAASGLYEVGFIDKKRMEKYNLLCHAPVPGYSPQKIKALRKRYDISQAVLAAVINTSLSTVSKWEIGEKHPSGPSLKLLNILDLKGIEVFIDQQDQPNDSYRSHL